MVYQAFEGCTLLNIKSSAQGLAISEWGRANWERASVRLAVAAAVRRLRGLSDTQLDRHIDTIPRPRKVSACVRFLVECGEDGLVREIIRYIA